MRRLHTGRPGCRGARASPAEAARIPAASDSTRRRNPFSPLCTCPRLPLILIFAPPVTLPTPDCSAAPRAALAGPLRHSRRPLAAPPAGDLSFSLCFFGTGMLAGPHAGAARLLPRLVRGRAAPPLGPPRRRRRAAPASTTHARTHGRHSVQQTPRLHTGPQEWRRRCQAGQGARKTQAASPPSHTAHPPSRQPPPPPPPAT